MKKVALEKDLEGMPGISLWLRIGLPGGKTNIGKRTEIYLGTKSSEVVVLYTQERKKLHNLGQDYKDPFYQLYFENENSENLCTSYKIADISENLVPSIP